MADLARVGHVVDGRADVEEDTVLLEALVPAAVDVAAVELLAALLLASWVK